MEIKTYAIVTFEDGQQFTPKEHHLEFLSDILRAKSDFNFSPKIPAIKFLRAEYGLHLKNANDFVDELSSTNLGELLHAKIDA